MFSCCPIKYLVKSAYHFNTTCAIYVSSYIGYMVRSGSCKDVRDIVCRSIISMPIKRQIPFTTASASTWLDYEPSHQLVEVWLEVLPPQDRLDLMEMCLGFFPGNLQLLLRQETIANLEKCQLSKSCFFKCRI